MRNGSPFRHAFSAFSIARSTGLLLGLDAFGFPSPVETQGLVALESIASATPVVGVDRGALRETIDPGETGYRYPPGDVDAFARCLERALENGDRLEERCLGRREELDVERVIDRLAGSYESVAEQ